MSAARELAEQLCKWCGRRRRFVRTDGASKAGVYLLCDHCDRPIR